VTTDALLTQLQTLGIELYLDGNRPMLKPANAAGPVLMRALKWHRKAILKRMGVDPEAVAPPPVNPDEGWEYVPGKGWFRKGLSEEDRAAAERQVFR